MNAKLFILRRNELNMVRMVLGSWAGLKFLFLNKVTDVSRVTLITELPIALLYGFDLTI